MSVADDPTTEASAPVPIQSSRTTPHPAQTATSEAPTETREARQPETVDPAPANSVDEGVETTNSRTSANRQTASCVAVAPEFLSAPSTNDGRRDAEADRIERTADGRYSAEGSARLTGADQILSGERIVYDPVADRVTADSGIELRTPELVARGSRLDYRIGINVGEVTNAQYWLRAANTQSGVGRGRASLLSRVGPDRYRAERLDYTTCPDGNSDWVLATRQLDVDQDKGFATARDALLRFKGVPVLYAPWFRFPVDDRRHTGLLAPTLQRSDRRGTELITPFYWNIAPNRDATLTPRLMSRRGLLIESEWRVWERWGRAELDANLLPNDRVNHQSRHLLRLQSDATLALPGGDWRWTIDATDLSDPAYVRDFGQRDLGDNLNFVERRTQLDRGVGRGRLSILLQSFQIANPLIAVEPYQRLPQIRLTQQFGDVTGLYGAITADHTHFDRSEGVIGQRSDIELRAGLRIQRGFWFAEPRLGLRATHYNLSRTPADIDDRASRFVPDIGFEVGADFERPTQTGVQTLEPRLFYGYVPYRDQSRLPNFDTSAISFDLDRLFTNERFVGGDRVGDIHQLSALVTTRFLDFARGLDRLALTLGARQLIDSPRVTGPGTGRGFDPKQAVLARVEYAFNPRLSLDAQTAYDIERERVDFGDVALRYRSRGERLVSLNYRYQASGETQLDNAGVKLIDVASLWPVTPRTQLIGALSRDLDQGRTVDIIAGVTYRSCCWGLRVLARRNFAEDLGRFENGFLIQFTLDGLSRYDTGVERTLRESIPGYERTR
ncbi:MAG: LPS-assembly protein LptD [Thioalkalivibrionaceae bacterium]